MSPDNSSPSVLEIIERALYGSLLGIINIFIFVGEATTNTFLAPFRLLKFFVQLALNLLVYVGERLEAAFLRTAKYVRTLSQKEAVKPVKAPKPEVKFVQPKIQAPSLKLPRIRLPRLKLPQLKVPRISFPKIRFPRLKRVKVKQIAIVSKRKEKLKIAKIRVKRVKRRFGFLPRFRYFIIGFLTASLFVFVQQTYLFVVSLPSPKNIGKVNYPQTTHILDRNGRLLYEVYRDQNRTPVQLESVPKYVWQASVAIEDKDFFKHNGVSLFGGIVRATKETLLTKKVQGGSTITQQLVKSALLTPERTIQRKAKEIVLALWAERMYTKNQILQMYLNQVPYGGSSYGIEEAAQTYFNKSAKDLTLSEAALLAGLPQAPSIYSPFVNPDLAIRRRNEVLVNMKEQEYITENQYQQARNISVAIEAPKTNIKAPHFVFYVKSELEKQFGIHNVEEGGLKVNTSLDLPLQEKVQEILAEEIGKIKGLNVSNGAVLVTEPSTGEILAMAGSVDYFATPSGAFNATTALRQPGSSIKPIMYSLALTKGFTAASPIDDTPTSFGRPPGEVYRPVNYDGRFHGRVPLRYALANSYNVPAVKTLNAVGVDNFVDHARNMGVSTWSDPSRFGLSLTLGGGEVKMTDMAKAFGVFANLGKRVELSPFIKVKNDTDDTIYDLLPETRSVLDENVSYIMSDILSDNVARQSAFGPNSDLVIPGYKVAVKTGTTDSKKDNWTIGYTPEYLVAVWVGNNDNTPMNPAITSGLTGASPIWHKVMQYVLTSYSTKNSWFNKPEGVVEKNCYGNRREVFVRGTENVFCQTGPKPLPSLSITPSPAVAGQ